MKSATVRLKSSGKHDLRNPPGIGAPGNPAGIPPGGPPLPNPGGAPGKPGGAPPGNPGNPAGGAAPPIPGAGPCSPIGRPRPTGLLIPGPATIPAAAPAGVGAPSLAAGSEWGPDSTVRVMMWVPRTMVRPSGRFSFVSVIRPSEDPGAEDLLFFRFTIRNSSVSASTRFIC